MATRIFAILAAVFLVTAVAVAALAPLGLTLAQGALFYDRGSVEWLRQHSSGWVWTWLELPFLLRPLWLLPACLGVVCAGLAMTLNLQSASPSRRKRS